LAAAGVTLTVAGDPDALPAGAGAVLAMTLREAVTNVVRHADASWCAVEIEHLGGGARLTVTDDGTGGSVKEGSGLTGMRQRLVAAGGSLTLDDAPPGLRLVADVPT
jgi:two-component system sensor histidine kinase DesK